MKVSIITYALARDTAQEMLGEKKGFKQTLIDSSLDLFQHPLGIVNEAFLVRDGFLANGRILGSL